MAHYSTRRFHIIPTKCAFCICVYVFDGIFVSFLLPFIIAAPLYLVCVCECVCACVCVFFLLTFVLWLRYLANFGRAFVCVYVFMCASFCMCVCFGIPCQRGSACCVYVKGSGDIPLYNRCEEDPL